MNTTTRTAIALTAGTALLLIPVGVGAAKDDNRAEVRVIGDCSARTDWKLKAKERDGGLEVEFEVDSNRVGQTCDFAERGPIRPGQSAHDGPQRIVQCGAPDGWQRRAGHDHGTVSERAHR